MLSEIISSIKEMPLTMKKLAAIQFFSWFAFLLCGAWQTQLLQSMFLMLHTQLNLNIILKMLLKK